MERKPLQRVEAGLPAAWYYEPAHYQRELGFDAKVARARRRDSESLRCRDTVRCCEREFERRYGSESALSFELQRRQYHQRRGARSQRPARDVFKLRRKERPYRRAGRRDPQNLAR